MIKEFKNCRKVQPISCSIVDDVIENWLPLIKQILNLNYKMKSRSIYFIVKNNKYMYLTFNKEVAIFLNYQTIM